MDGLIGTVGAIGAAEGRESLDEHLPKLKTHKNSISHNAKKTGQNWKFIGNQSRFLVASTILSHARKKLIFGKQFLTCW